MRRLQKDNLNTPAYWNEIYNREADRRAEYNNDRYCFIGNYIYHNDIVLDIGCGDGSQCGVIKSMRPTAEVHGIDISEAGILMAKRIHNKCEFKLASAYETGYTDDFFTFVVCGETIEHLDEPERMIKEAARVLKKDGKLLISCPYNENEQDGGWVDEHLWSFEGEDLAQICRKYFKKVWYMPWASGSRRLFNYQKQIVRDVGYLDFLILLAIK